jgi:plasmid replication initiation protein
MSNKLVIYHNDVGSVAFRKFKSVEHNIFDALVYNFREKGTEQITFTFQYLKELIDYKDTDTTSFAKLLDSMYNKLIKCDIKIGNSLEWTRFVLFIDYTISIPKQSITVSVHPKFAYILNSLQANFTQYELMNSLNLRSTYAKVFYKHMMQYKSTGIWKVEIEEFRRLMDIPEKYSVSDIDKWVLTPILKEINDLKTNKDELYHYNLKVKKIYEVVGRGRPRVSAFEFKFRKELSKAQIEKSSKIASVSKEQKLKPKLHQQVMKDGLVKAYDDIYVKNNKTTIRLVAKDGNSNTFYVQSIFKNLDNKIIMKAKNTDNDYIKEFEFRTLDELRIYIENHII